VATANDHGTGAVGLRVSFIRAGTLRFDHQRIPIKVKNPKASAVTREQDEDRA
jgi:hypothetical protein